MYAASQSNRLLQSTQAEHCLIPMRLVLPPMPLSPRVRKASQAQITNRDSVKPVSSLGMKMRHSSPFTRLDEARLRSSSSHPTAVTTVRATSASGIMLRSPDALRSEFSTRRIEVH